MTRARHHGAVDLNNFEALVRDRRTSLLVDSADDVSIDLVERLCGSAMWAPNHKKTWPLRFSLCTGDGRVTLGETVAEALLASGVTDEAKLAKTRAKYLRSPAVLVVGSAPGDTPLRTAENRDAVAAGVQNLLLAATAAGLASFWASVGPVADEPLASWFGWESGTQCVAIVYLGWPTGAVPVPGRPPVTLAVFDR